MLIELGRQEVTIKSPFLYLAICGESPQSWVFRRHTAGLIKRGIDFCSINCNIKRSYMSIAQKDEYVVLVTNLVASLLIKQNIMYQMIPIRYVLSNY